MTELNWSPPDPGPGVDREECGRRYLRCRDLPGKEYPDTHGEMAPLLDAVYYGCRAGRYGEVLHDIYWKRINRGNERYLSTRLGAAETDLALLACFFSGPWTRPHGGLSGEDRAMVLGLAARGLRGAGRLAEAVAATEAGLAEVVRLGDPIRAAREAGALCDMMLRSGNHEKSVEYGRKAVEFADRGAPWEERVTARCALARALHLGGQKAEAETSFQGAESLQAMCQPEFPFLYAVQGYHYCGLLLDLGRYDDVIERAGRSLTFSREYLGPLEEALDCLSLGRAYAASGDRGRAVEWLDRAIKGLEECSDKEKPEDHAGDDLALARRERGALG